MKHEIVQWLIFIGALIALGFVFAVITWWGLSALDGRNPKVFASGGTRVIKVDPPKIDGTAIFINDTVVTGTSIGLKKVPVPAATEEPKVVSGSSIKNWITHGDEEEDTDIDETDLGDLE